MKHLAAAILAAAALIPSPAHTQVTRDPATEAAESFIASLRDGRFSAAESMVEPAVRAALNASQLEALWRQLTASGALEGWTIARVQSAQGYRVVDLAARFGPEAVKLRVAVGAEGQVGGFFMLPPDPLPYQPPAYVDTAAFREETLTFGDATFRLGATLTIPEGEGPFGVVVLVHGSGPQDRDETIGANRPFRDLAWGLATRGVAVLRYDKRTYAHGSRMTAEVTVEEEVIADALSALEAARAHRAIDAGRSWLLGHSLGAMLAPEIAVQDARTAGLISLAGSPRPLHELIREQLLYVAMLPENASPDAQARVVEAMDAAQRLAAREAPPDEVVLGAPASYYYDLVDRDVTASARVLEVPMLFLQGGRDYQVTPRDLELWRELLGERPDVRFVLFDDLNHLFMTGTGLATPAEYTTGSGHVDALVIDEIAGFVGASPPGAPASPRADQHEDAKAFVLRYNAVAATGDWDALARLFHPVERQALKNAVASAVATDTTGELVAALGIADTIGVGALEPGALMAAFLGFAFASQPAALEMLRSGTVEFGVIETDPDPDLLTVHYVLHYEFEGVPMTQRGAFRLRRHDAQWRALLSDDVERLADMLLRSIR